MARIKRSCPVCGAPIPPHVYVSHVRTCEKHPGNDELVRLYEVCGYSMREIADLLGVSEPTVRKWVKVTTIEPRKTNTGGLNNSGEDVKVLWTWSVRKRCAVAGCRGCSDQQACRER